MGIGVVEEIAGIVVAEEIVGIGEIVVDQEGLLIF